MMVSGFGPTQGLTLWQGKKGRHLLLIPAVWLVAWFLRRKKYQYIGRQSKLLLVIKYLPSGALRTVYSKV